MAVQVQRLRFTVDEYHRLAQAGILGEDDRVELLDGEILVMAPISSRHAAAVNRLNALFSALVRRQAVVAVQNPVRLSLYSEPQPDIALLRPRPDFYASAHPQPPDVLLLVEVADASLPYDREVKLPLYARAGIPEVWLVNLASDTVEVYRSPSPQGYEDAHTLPRGQRLSPHLLPQVSVAVEDILG
ncbi:MAG: Uma2 family endonuclease [Dehalococcoidia bacterium]|nr:Uma2 family endonuclease [Dehalococcoidia bacterium]